MFEGLGIHWASSIPAFLALACTPFPFLFYKYGPAIRARCKFAAEAAQFLERMRGQQPQPKGEGGADASDEVASSADEPTAAEEKEDEKEREEDAEQEAFDHSYEDETELGVEDSRFKSIKPGGVKRTTTNHSLSGRQSVDYDQSPYDIDRVHSNEYFGRINSRSPTSRPTSIRSGRSAKMF